MKELKYVSQEAKDFFDAGFKNGTLLESLPGVQFKRGDIVTYTNQFGVNFPGIEVAALGMEHSLAKYGNCIFLNKTSFWFPVHPDSVTIER